VLCPPGKHVLGVAPAPAGGAGVRGAAHAPVDGAQLAVVDDGRPRRPAGGPGPAALPVTSPKGLAPS
jgi:hypothetical protein